MGHYARKVLSIHSNGVMVKLPVGLYSIRVLGGWGVDLGQFSMKLINAKNGKVINCKPVRLKTQSFEFGKRAKKIMTLDIAELGEYIVEFQHASTMILRPSNLFISKLFFEQDIPNQSIEICIN